MSSLMEPRAGLMRPISFQSLRSYISIVLLIALVWISFGSAKLPGTLAVVFADSDPVIAAAGDIACDPANTNFNNGEGNQAFLQSYDSGWGRLKSISHPVVGNHEYLTSDGTDCTSYNEGAAGYFRYFGSAAGNPSQGYYSYDIGTWHLIALNSNCGDAGGCGYGSPQAMWLAADLTAHPNLCTLAYWHIPLFSSGGRAASNTQVIWQILYNHDVDV